MRRRAVLCACKIHYLCWRASQSSVTSDRKTGLGTLNADKLAALGVSSPFVACLGFFIGASDASTASLARRKGSERPSKAPKGRRSTHRIPVWDQSRKSIVITRRLKYKTKRASTGSTLPCTLPRPWPRSSYFLSTTTPSLTFPLHESRLKVLFSHHHVCRHLCSHSLRVSAQQRQPHASRRAFLVAWR